MFMASVLAYIKAEKTLIWLQVYIMLVLMIFRLYIFITNGIFFSDAFPVITYSMLKIVVDLKYLGKGE